MRSPKLSISVPTLKHTILDLQVSAEVGDREPWEVFYACPSATAPAFLAAAADLAAVAAQPGGAAELAEQPAAERLAALSVLARATQVRRESCTSIDE